MFVAMVTFQWRTGGKSTLLWSWIFNVQQLDEVWIMSGSCCGVQERPLHLRRYSPGHGPPLTCRVIGRLLFLWEEHTFNYFPKISNGFCILSYSRPMPVTTQHDFGLLQIHLILGIVFRAVIKMLPVIRRWHCTLCKDDPASNYSFSWCLQTNYNIFVLLLALTQFGTPCKSLESKAKCGHLPWTGARLL